MEQRQFQPRPSFSQRGPRQPFQRQKNDDFLQGRITRADEDDASSTADTNALKKQDETRTITLPLDDMTLTELSILYRIKVDDIKKKLKSMGERVNDEYMLDVDMSELLAMEYGFETVRENPRTVMDAEQILLQRRAGAEEVEESSISSTTEVEKPSFDSLPPRPPVVCIMGHVDHGKTTLMDALRRRSLQQQQGGGGVKEKKQKGGATAAKSKDVAGTEAGGITQIISAFQVALEGQDSAVTFLDTPGHAAFSAMRQSGSHAADVIVLVVAADDGISEQTIEIINFYKAIVKGAGDSGISMIVALNKIDKPGLDVDQAKTRIENQLLEHGIITEGLNYSGSEYGLPVTVIPTSGLTGQGLDELMESLILQSEIMDLRADDKARAEGIVMDARLEKGLGVVVDCIVRWGSIKKGDVVVSGTQLGKVRMLKDGE
jgi:translation initiation factor IF-2